MLKRQTDKNSGKMFQNVDFAKDSKGHNGSAHNFFYRIFKFAWDESLSEPHLRPLILHLKPPLR